MIEGLSELISSLLGKTPPRAKSLIVTLLGDCIKPHGGTLWIGTLIELIEPFAINERSVRTSVQRLSQDGWLASQRKGRRSKYNLTKVGLARIEQASPRMYSPAQVEWDGRWTVAFAPPGSLQGWQRSELRQNLEWEGYSMAASGLFIHPLGNPENVREMLEEIKILDKVFVFRGESIPEVGAMDLRDGVSEFWDLQVAREHYQEYIDEFEKWLEILLQTNAMFSALECFQARLLAIHNFRRASLHAPRLPAALFPDNWPGVRAYEICKHIYQLTWLGAEQYMSEVFAQGDEAPSNADESFHRRFGGLLDNNIKPIAPSTGANGRSIIA